MIYELTEDGYFLSDQFESEGLSNWTKDSPMQPCHTPKYVGTKDSTGEWTGKWIETFHE